MIQIGSETKVLPAIFRLFLVLVTVLLLNADRAVADAEMQMSSGSDCTDPTLNSTVFPTFSANATGGGCQVFTNLSGGGFNSVQFTTAFTSAGNFFCDGNDLFTSCGFSVDGGAVLPSGSPITSGNMLTILFFGVNPPGPTSGHPGIPNDTSFRVLLNGPCRVTATCPDPTSEDGAGGWKVGDTPSQFEGMANVPEPNMRILALCGAAAILTRPLMLARRRRQIGRSRTPGVS